jgi:hypothetical protein
MKACLRGCVHAAAFDTIQHVSMTMQRQHTKFSTKFSSAEPGISWNIL